MENPELTNAKWWADLWENIEHWAFLGVVLTLAIEFTASHLLKGPRKIVDDERQVEIAELSKEAETLRSANLALEAQIAPRRLSHDQIASLQIAVRPFAGRPVSIWSYGIDLEAGMLAREIKSTLESAHVPVVDNIGHFVTSWTPRVGVIITGPDDKLVEALTSALKPVSAVKGSFDSTKSQNPAPAEIFVGVKPLSE